MKPLDWGDSDRDESGVLLIMIMLIEVIIKTIMIMIVRVMTFIYICSKKLNPLTDNFFGTIPQ